MRIKRFMACVALASATSASPVPVLTQETDQGSPQPARLRVVRPRLEEAVVRSRRESRNEVPQLVGFRAPVLGFAAPSWTNATAENGEETAAGAAAYVAAHLGRDGLVRTLIELVRRFDLPWINDKGCPNEPLLWHVGMPVDLLRFFHPADKTGPEPCALTRRLKELIAGGASEEAVEAYARSVRFDFRPSIGGFEITPEDGSAEITLFRMQLSLPDVLLGEGDGTPADIFRQLATKLEKAAFIISIHEDHAAAFEQAFASWQVPDPARVTAVVDQLRFTQWAQDNCKTGLTSTPPLAEREVVTLIPRYASQGEWSSTFMPAESYIFDSLTAAGFKVVQSPLLFQGGNLLPVRDPKTGGRILFLGEAEVLRNRSLGLSPEQVETAMRAEFGVDRCVVLPAVSFHIDLEVAMRVCGGRLTAFVNDGESAAAHAVRLGIETFASSGLLQPSQAADLEAQVRRREYRSAAPAMWHALAGVRLESGELPEDFARHFVRSSAECAADNLKRFLLALDTLTAISLSDRDMESELLPEDRRHYYRLLRQRESERRKLHDFLREHGLEVVKVASFSDEEVSINYINGVHGREWYLMPVLGGYFEALDTAAKGVFARTLDPGVQVLPISSGLSQRRYGGVHCSVSVYPGSQ